MKYDFRCCCGDRWHGDCPANTVEVLKHKWAGFHGEHPSSWVEVGEQEELPAEETGTGSEQ
jgi:hypothetical protein